MDEKVRLAHLEMLTRKLNYLVADREYIRLSRPDNEARRSVLADLSNLIQITGTQIADLNER